VEKRILRLARDRRAAFTPDELLALERVESLFEGPTWLIADRGYRAKPENLAEDGRVLHQSLLLGGESIEPCGDEPLHRLGERQPLCTFEPPAASVTAKKAPILEHAHVLLGIERVPFRASEERRLDFRGEDSLLE
jgi:hypothetical protein